MADQIAITRSLSLHRRFSRDGTPIDHKVTRRITPATIEGRDEGGSSNGGGGSAGAGAGTSGGGCGGDGSSYSSGGPPHITASQH
uniref:Uncharacterized protein n=1 Tax=Vespula pensylvanica TaxID=30213 RepID=A0A834N1G1_VESPE|nr:hypothetical protein H0235_017329 [Vespula pensylvanica]